MVPYNKWAEVGTDESSFIYFTFSMVETIEKIYFVEAGVPWLSFQSGISHIAPVVNLAVQSFSPM